MRFSIVCLPLVFVAMLSSCALQERLDALNPTIPQRLDASPETTGLLIIDVQLKQKGSLSLGRELPVSVSDATVRRADTRVTTLRGAVRPLVIFELAPGTYELVSVRGTFSQGATAPVSYTVEPFLGSEVEPVDIVAGQISYIGKFTAIAHSKLGQFGFKYTHSWDHDPARQAEALAIVEQRFPDSPWVAVIGATKEMPR